VIRSGQLALLVLAMFLVPTPNAEAGTGWLSPTTLFTAPVQAPSQAGIAMDANGDTWVAWTTSSGAVEISSRPAGKTFGAPVRLSAGGQNASCASLGVDSAGDATVVWSQSDGVYTAYEPTGGSSGAATSVSAGVVAAHCPGLYVASQGDTSVEWDDSAGDVYATSRASSGSFLPPAHLSTAPATQAELTGNASGDAVVAWLQGSGTAQTIWFAGRTTGNPFVAAQQGFSSAGGSDITDISVAMGASGYPTIASAVNTTPGAGNPTYEINANGFTLASTTETFLYLTTAANSRGDSVVVWKTFNFVGSGASGSNETIAAAIQPGLVAGFGPTQVLSQDTTRPYGAGLSVDLSAGPPVPAIDSAGNVTVAWLTPGAAIVAASAQQGGTFGSRLALSNPADFADPPDLISNPSGLAVVAWPESPDLTSWSLQASAGSVGGTFAPEMRVSPSIVAPQHASIAIDPQGDAAATWVSPDGPSYDTDVAGFENTPPQFGAVTIPASGRFGVQLAFSATGSSVWSPLSTSWSWGDGTPETTGSSSTHTFQKAGAYHVTVSESDALGNAVSTTRTVTISGPPSATIGTIRLSGATAIIPVSCSGQTDQSCSETVAVTTRERKRRGSIVAVAATAGTNKTASKLKTVTVTVANKSFTVAAGHNMTLRLTLNATGKALLARFYLLPTRLALNGTSTSTRTVTFAYTRIRSPVNFQWTYTPTYTIAQQLSVTGLPPDATVKVGCHGSGCPFPQRAFKPRKRQVALTGLFAHTRLSPGTTLKVTITAPNSVGKVVIFKTRSASPPTVAARCLPPGYPHPVACA
jgi:hypothetical protein